MSCWETRRCWYYVCVLFNYSGNLLSNCCKAGAAKTRSKFITDAKTTSLVQDPAILLIISYYEANNEFQWWKICFSECLQQLNGTKERIKKIFYNTDLSVSSYDTAWVAMVPSPDTLQSPCFPQCINWLLDNQLQDGSWGLPQRPSWLVKDALSCTLASVLALKRWGIGEEQMSKGILF